MITPPRFGSIDQHVAHVDDIDSWWPFVAEVLGRHGRLDAGREPVAGFNASYPTFIYGEVVVKLLGTLPAWRQVHEAERAAHALVAADGEIRAPALLAEGRLFDDAEHPWPYLMTARVPGVASHDAALSPERRASLAAAVGEQIRRVHALPVSGFPSRVDGVPLDVTAAAGRSSLPPHLVRQAEAFVARLGGSEATLVHGDVTANHVFLEGDRLTGIIDWGDAAVTDRHYELIQIHRDLFGCDKVLLRVFLDAYGWRVDGDFARRALGFALVRQAVGLTQHHAIDVFEPVADVLPLEDIGTLDQLATELFAV